MRYAGAFILFVLFFSASFTMFTVEASWTKVAGFKFISGTSLGSETTYYGELDDARPPCQQRCDNLKPCKAIRLYSFVGTVYCTLFKTITDYSCPTDSTDWNCFFADGESWMKSN
ncbi:uncharacterized protein LOC144631976 [Oculina patagonica]